VLSAAVPTALTMSMMGRLKSHYRQSFSLFPFSFVISLDFIFKINIKASMMNLLILMVD
jgi:hypothetical protein